MTLVDSGRLDDLAELTAADPGEMLRQVASAAAQVRQAQLQAAEAGLDRLARDGRPRAVVVAGRARSGDVLAALCGRSSPVPVVGVRGPRLPGWVGAADLVLAVSGSGRTEETLAVAADAVRRGSGLVCVGPPDGPLAAIAEQGRATFVPVQASGRESRALLWALTVPVVLAARTIGLLDVPHEALETVAARLEAVSHTCRPASDSFLNPGKQLALDLAGAIPLVWADSPLAAVAARRFTDQLAENAKYPGVYGEVPETVGVLDGRFGGTSSGGDFYRDRVEDTETGLHVVLLRDDPENAQVSAAVEVARGRGIPVTELPAEGGHPLERFATMVALADYATVYLAIALEIDPTPVAALAELRARTG
jgi:glucose/mannose-6-phosphate isomerase